MKNFNFSPIHLTNLLISLIMIILVGLSSFAWTDQKQIFEMSLEELVNLKVNFGTLSETERYKLPFSLTTIEQDDIRLTPR